MNNPDWMRLTPNQREDVTSLRDRMNKHLVAEMKTFHKDHPGLQLYWAFVCDALIRVDSASIKTWNDGLVDEWAIPKNEILSVLNRLYNYYDGRARAAVRTSSGNTLYWEAKRDAIEKVAENLVLTLNHKAVRRESYE